MKFNLTALEFTLFVCVCVAISIWTKHENNIRRWLQDYFRQRRGPRNLKAKSPEYCPQCSRNFSRFPQRPKLDFPPWPERRSRNGCRSIFGK